MTAASKSGMSEELTEHEERLKKLEAAAADADWKLASTRFWLVLAIFFVVVVIVADHYFTFYVLHNHGH